MPDIKKHLVRKRSPIHGHGLFTNIAIKKGDLLGRCRVKIIPEPNSHTLWCEDGYFEVLCKLKYINHSEEPNVVYYDDFTVVALRNISVGDELTHCYGEDAWA